MIFLAYRSKKFTYKHLSAQRKPFGRVSFLASVGRITSDCLRYRIADKKRELALSTHRTYHTDHQYILAPNFHNNETAYDQYAHTRHPARPYDCHPRR